MTTCDMLGIDRRLIHGLTMPGFGTTQRTRTNALALMEHLGVAAETIDISGAGAADISGNRPRSVRHRLPRPRRRASYAPRWPACRARRCSDLTFENVQARLRTFLLMSKGFVVGTGDLSELALGWSTYNGDHMSMYNPNCSIPKTLVKFLVRYVALNQFPEGAVRQTLLSIVETTISPELLPAGAAGEIEQSTEATLGPYEVLDFILYHAIRCGYSPAKILFMSQFATLHSALSSRSSSSGRSARFTTGSSVSNTSGRAFPTGPRSARSACRRAATGECPPTPIRPHG